MVFIYFTFPKVPEYTLKNVTGPFCFSLTILKALADSDVPKYLNVSSVLRSFGDGR